MENTSGKLDEFQQAVSLWPEWNDAEVNATKWDLGNVKDKSKNKRTAKKTPNSPELETPPVFFEDEAGILSMPDNIKVASWVHSQTLFPNGTCSLAPENEPLDLFSQNIHLMNYEVMRFIISSIVCLEHEACVRPFSEEFQSPKFIANGGLYWKPWHHVYGHSKVGKGTQHNMLYNSYGKYIVRLFYVGKWRQIIVDDILPVDRNEQILLPCSKTQSNIWLPILCKALLRVGALSQFREFSVIHCLTGWIYTNLNSRNVSPYCLWHICCQLMPTTQEVTGPPGCCKQESVTCLPDNILEQFEATSSRAMFAYISQINQVEPLLPGLTPCLDHLLLIHSARFNDEEPNPRWKEYRWKEWAYNKGLISDIKPKPVRNVNLFCPFQKRESTVVEAPVSATSTAASSPKKKESKKSKKSTKSTKSKNESTKKQKKVNVEKDEIIVEASKEWIDFDELIKYLKSIQVFYKPSFFEFQHNSFSITELSTFVGTPKVSKEGKATKSKQGASSKKKEKSPVKSVQTKKAGQKAKESSNIAIPTAENHCCFYFISDTQFCKTFYISASGIGSMLVPEKSISASGTGKKSVLEKQFYVIGEAYNWRSKQFGEIKFILKSSNLKSTILKLEPGLQVLRIWYNFPKDFSFHIYSSTTFTTCLKIQMQELLSCDSVTFNYYGEQISNYFKILLDSAPGGQEHGESFTNFIHSFNPPSVMKQLCWPYWFHTELNLQQTFEESLIEMLINTGVTPSTEFFQTMEAFKLLFLNPKFGDKTLELISDDHSAFLKFRKLSKEEKLLLEGRIQHLEGGKMLGSKKKNKTAVKSNKSSEKEAKSDKISKASKQSKQTSKSAKANSLIKFIEVPSDSLLLTSPEYAKTLLRLMMSKLPQMKKYYPLKNDDINYLSFCDYIGEGKISNNWALLCNCIMNLHISSPTPCSFHVLAPLRKAIIRIIDRDTMKDIHLGTLENPVCFLSQNQSGYLVCAYGTLKPPFTKDFQWKLRVVGEANGDLLHLCTFKETGQCVPQTVLPSQFLQCVTGCYFPNRWDLIGRCLINVTAENSVFLRLVLSSDTVQCSIKVVNEVGNIAAYAEGVGEIIVPAIDLQGPDEEKKVMLYEVEIKLLNNSWPLTNAQKVASYLVKEKLENHELFEDSVYEVPETDFIKNMSSVTKMRSYIDKNDLCCWEVIIAGSHQKPLQVRLIPDTRLVRKLYEYVEDLSITEGSRQRSGQVHRYIFCKDILKEDLEDLENLENKSVEDIFNIYPVKTTNFIHTYGEPLYEEVDERNSGIKISSHSSSILDGINRSPHRNNKHLTHKSVVRLQEKVNNCLALYTQREKEKCVREMEGAINVREQNLAEFIALSKKITAAEVKDKK